jgi:hypothetical protein
MWAITTMMPKTITAMTSQLSTTTGCFFKGKHVVEKAELVQNQATIEPAMSNNKNLQQKNANVMTAASTCSNLLQPTPTSNFNSTLSTAV